MGKALIIITMGFSMIFGSLMLSLSANQQRTVAQFVTQYEHWLARNATESALNVASSKLYQDDAWRAGFTNRTFAGASWSAEVADLPGDSTTQAVRIQIRVTAGFEGAADSAQAVYMKPGYSYYQLFQNNWASALEFQTGDTLVGPIHANDRIRIRGNPVFLSKVSSSDGVWQALLGSDNPKFYGGAEFGTAVIPLPDLDPLTNEGLAGGHRFTQELWLRFKADGTYDYSTDGWGTEFNEALTTFNGIIMTEPGTNRDIHVEGVVNGQATVLADRDIKIEDDVVYASNPLTDPNSDDYLGLVARHRVRIVENAPNSADVIIHAAILAHHDQLHVENYNKNGPWGMLTLLGSLVQNQYRPVGTATTGYAFNPLYDWRLRDRTPPFFPRVDRLELLYRSN